MNSPKQLIMLSSVLLSLVRSIPTQKVLTIFRICKKNVFDRFNINDKKFLTANNFEIFDSFNVPRFVGYSFKLANFFTTIPS